MRIHLANIKSQTRQPRTHLRILNQKPENLEPIRQIPNQFDKIEPIWSIQDQMGKFELVPFSNVKTI